jgi:phosphoglycerate-specific signal transduction histidine kinase
MSNDTSKSAEAGKRRLGLRPRLFAAFGAVAGIALGATAAGFFSYERISGALDVIERDSMPAMNDALRLTHQAAETTAAGPRLLSASSPKEGAEASAALKKSQAEMAKIIEALGSSEHARALSGLTAELGANLQQLADAVHQRMTLTAAREKKSAEIMAAHQRLVEKLTPLVDDSSFSMQMELQGATERTELTEIQQRLQAIADREMAEFQAMLELRAEANLLLGLLGEAATAPSIANLTPLLDRFSAASSRTRNALKSIPNESGLAELMQPLLAQAAGKDSVFELRRSELGKAALVGNALERVPRA